MCFAALSRPKVARPCSRFMARFGCPKNGHETRADCSRDFFGQDPSVWLFLRIRRPVTFGHVCRCYPPVSTRHSGTGCVYLSVQQTRIPMRVRSRVIEPTVFSLIVQTRKKKFNDNNKAKYSCVTYRLQSIPFRWISWIHHSPMCDHNLWQATTFKQATTNHIGKDPWSIF